MNSLTPTYDAQLERERCLDNHSRRLVDKLGFESRDELDFLATQATRTALSQVVSFADYLGIQSNVLDQLEENNPSLVLPGYDHSGRRYEILHGYGFKKTTQLKPSVQFLRQVLLITQVAYDDTFGIIDSRDSTHIKRETIGYACKYGIGLRLYELLETTTAPNQRLFSKNNEQRGKHSLAGFFALTLSKPLPKISYYDPEHAEYITNFTSRAPMIRSVLKKSHPRRANEFNDACSFGIERPMKPEELNILANGLPNKQKPHLRLVT